MLVSGCRGELPDKSFMVEEEVSNDMGQPQSGLKGQLKTEYAAIIFYHDEKQKEAALKENICRKVLLCLNQARISWRMKII